MALQVAISTVYGLTGPMLEDAATAAAEDKKWAALSTELNNSLTAVKRAMRRLNSPHSAFSMLRKCRYLGRDADDEAIVKFVAGGLSHAWSRN